MGLSIPCAYDTLADAAKRCSLITWAPAGFAWGVGVLMTARVSSIAGG